MIAGRFFSPRGVASSGDITGLIVAASADLTYSPDPSKLLCFDPVRVVISSDLEGCEYTVTPGVQALHPGQKSSLVGAQL